MVKAARLPIRRAAFPISLPLFFYFLFRQSVPAEKILHITLASDIHDFFRVPRSFIPEARHLLTRTDTAF